jgi:sec-independent protein translocase protein TatB
MFDIAWTELLIIGAVALVVIGPKDLPKVLKTVGMMVNKARGLAREFQSGLDDMVRESELEELRKAGKLDIAAEANKIVDPTGELARIGEDLSRPPDTPSPELPVPEPTEAEPVALPTASDPFIPPPASEPEAAPPAAGTEPPKPAATA